MTLNAAGLTAALWVKTRFPKHRYHDVFESREFETESMRPPADGELYDLEAAAIMLPAESDAVRADADIRGFVAAIVDVGLDHRYRIDAWDGRPG